MWDMVDTRFVEILPDIGSNLLAYNGYLCKFRFTKILVATIALNKNIQSGNAETIKFGGHICAVW
jgi:hypothetical protein